MAPKDMTAVPDVKNSCTQTQDAATAELHPTGNLLAPGGGMRKDEQQTTTTSHTHDSAIETPRANFPLPRELRDHIYSYLLDAKHTRIKRARIGDRAYKFHTGILGVNREIHDEAEEYLYKHNVFVVISHQFMDPVITGSASFAPWAAQLDGVDFVHRSLGLYLSEAPHGDSQQSGIAGSNWLFLAQDLDSYCQIVLLPLCSRVQDVPHLLLNDVDSILDRSVDEEGLQLNADHMRVEFCNPRYSRATRELQNSLLAPLRSLGRPGMLLSICGDVVDSPSVRDLETSVGSNLVCNSALSWHIIGALDGVRAAADTSAQAGELAVAVYLYEKAVKLTGEYGKVSILRIPQVHLVLLKLLANTELTMAYLYLKAKNAVRFAEVVTNILGMMRLCVGVADQDDNPEAPGMFHLHMLAVVVSPSEALRPPLPPITIAECIARLSITESDYRSHDVAILRQCPNQDKNFAPEDLPVDSCSFFATDSPVRCIGKRVRKPDHIVGLLDVLQLRRIDTEKREQINKLQAERGWAITRFEDYDEADSLTEVA